MHWKFLKHIDLSSIYLAVLCLFSRFYLLNCCKGRKGLPEKRLLQRPCYLTKFGYVPYIVKKVTALSMCNGNTEMSPPIPMQNPMYVLRPSLALMWHLPFQITISTYQNWGTECSLRNEETTVHYCAEIMVPLQLKMESSVNTNFG